MLNDIYSVDFGTKGYEFSKEIGKGEYSIIIKTPKGCSVDNVFIDGKAYDVRVPEKGINVIDYISDKSGLKEITFRVKCGAFASPQVESVKIVSAKDADKEVNKIVEDERKKPGLMDKFLAPVKTVQKIVTILIILMIVMMIWRVYTFLTTGFGTIGAIMPRSKGGWMSKGYDRYENYRRYRR